MNRLFRILLVVIGVTGWTVAALAQSILPNGDMELISGDLLHWDYKTSGASVLYDPAGALSGNRYIKLDYNLGSNQEYTHAIFAVEPGTPYRFQGYYRTPEALSSGSVTVMIRWFKDYQRDWGQATGQAILHSDIGTVIAADWVEMTEPIQSPPDAVGADLTIWSGGQGPEGEVHFDLFTLTKDPAEYSARIYMLHEGWSHRGSGKYWSATTDLMCSMAGILAQLNTGEYIYLYGSPTYQDSSYRWALALATHYGAQLDFSFDHSTKYWELLNHLKHYVPHQEYIKFSYDHPYSCRWAMSFAGLEQCLAVEESLSAHAQSFMGLTEKESLIGVSEADAWTRFITYPDANRKMMVSNITNYPSDYRYYLGDLAVAEKAWCFWDSDGGQPQNTYVDWLDDDSRVMGVTAGDEGTRTSDLSIRGVAHIPSDWSWNLATLSRFASKTPRKPLRANPLTFRDIDWEDNVVYCTFVMTDGDNLQVLEGQYSFDSRWYGSPKRGTFNMGWQLAPSMTDYAPAIFSAYFDPVSPMSVTPKDSFVTGVNGDGYTYVGPSWDTSHAFGSATAAGTDLIATHAARLNEWMKEHAINIVTTMPFTRTEWLAYDYANYAGQLERPLGFLACTYSGCYVDAWGELKWAQDRDGFDVPVKSADYALWNASCGRTASQIATLVNAAPHSGAPGVDSFIYVPTHAWSWMESPDTGIMDEIDECISSMNDYVQVVRPDEFFMQIRLRLRTSQELNRYYNHLIDKASDLESAPEATADASAALHQAEILLAQAQGLIGSDLGQAFALLKQADEQVEVARLSFVSISVDNESLILDCPIEASPLFCFAWAEADSEALPVDAYQVQVDDDSDFSSPLIDLEVRTPVLSLPAPGSFLRVRARGASHGDWGAWSETLVIESVVPGWQLR